MLRLAGWLAEHPPTKNQNFQQKSKYHKKTNELEKKISLLELENENKEKLNSVSLTGSHGVWYVRWSIFCLKIDLNCAFNSSKL